MGAPLFLPRRTASIQPSQVARLDWSHPLASGLIAGVIPAQRFDFVTGRPYAQGGSSLATSAGPAGLGLLTNGSSSYITAPIPAITLTQWTIAAVLRANGPAVDTRAVSLANSTTTTPYIQIGTAAGDVRQVRVLAQSNGGGLPANQPSVGFGFDGTTHTIVLTYDGSNVRCYIDGVLDTTAPTSTGAAWTVNQFSVGAMVRTSAAAFWSGSSFLAMAAKRAWSDSEIKSWHASPYQMLAAPQQTITLSAGNTGVTGSLSSSLDGITLAASGQNICAGSFSPSLEGITISSSGLVGNPPSGTLAASLLGVTMSASGTQTNSGTLASTLGGVSASMSGTASPHATGTIGATLAGVGMSASGYQGASAPVAPTVYRRRAPHRTIQ